MAHHGTVCQTRRGAAGYWWGKVPAEGTHTVEYAVVPHEGRWGAADLPGECARWEEPLAPQIASQPPVEPSRSLLAVPDPIAVPTAWVDGDDLFVRLFNTTDAAVDCDPTLGVEPEAVHRTELDGRPVECLDDTVGNGSPGPALELPPFGLRTLRLDGAANGSRSGTPYLAVGDGRP